MKNTDDFHYEGKPLRTTAKSTSFAVSKDELDTKEDTGKSMKNALYIPQYAKTKDACADEATSNSAKIKPIALVVIKLHLLEGISQLSQSVTRKSIKVFLFFLIL